MNQIYTLLSIALSNRIKQILYPLSVFTLACTIVLLSSFSTKANLEDGTTKRNLNSSKLFVDELEEKDEPYFVVEQVGARYKQIKAVLEDMTILFRKDRIELYTDTKEPEFTYFVFKNSQMKDLPKGRKLISSSFDDIESEAMVNVLKSTKKEVSKFSEVVYESIYPNVDLIVSMSDDGTLRLNLETSIAKSLNEFEMELIGLDKLDFKSNNLSFQKKNKTINIISDSNMLSYNNSHVRLDQLSNQTKGLSFDISIK